MSAMVVSYKSSSGNFRARSAAGGIPPNGSGEVTRAKATVSPAMPASESGEKSAVDPATAADSALYPETNDGLSDKDVALRLVGGHAQTYDHEVEARVLRKIDWFFIPAMVMGKKHSLDPKLERMKID